MDFRLVILVVSSVTLLYGRCIVMGASVGSGRDRKVLLRQCDMPTVKNGMTRLRQRGKLIKFHCYKGYTLVGSLYAGCVGGKWDTPIPVCAKSGCAAPTNPANGFVMMERQGIMATFFCKEHYKAAGVQTAYCDGTEWDRPIGTCRSSSESSPRWCDFEVDDLCGWTHDDSHDFEWKRVLGVDNLKKFRTGPQHDHTTMTSNAGHYMLLESVNQLPEDRARLLSPVYPSHMSINTCFRFFYHMYGATVGTLRVYLKPMSVDMDTLVQDQSYLYFEISGNQKNMWRKAIFRIRETTEDFQIVLDGSAGNNHLSDIAVDDVALLDENQCPQDDDVVSSTTEIQLVSTMFPLVYDIQSCKNRCHERIPSAKVRDVISKIYIAGCDCHPECDDLVTCCPDYRDLCVFGTEDEMYVSHTIATEVSVRPTVILRDSTISDVKRTKTATTVTETKPTSTTILTTSTSTVRPKILTTTQNMEAVMSTTISLQERYPIVISTEYTNFEHNISSTSEELNTKSHEWLINTTDKVQFIPTWLIIALSTFLAAVIMFIATFSIIYYRKHYGPENYKKNAEQATRNVNEEFSEVRYLTSEEQLDFTLQTPETVRSQKN